MAPNFKFKDFDYYANRTPETSSLPRIRPAQLVLQHKSGTTKSSTAQFTNLRTLTLFTSPSMRNVDQMLEPP
jgi:hypothetical protein